MKVLRREREGRKGGKGRRESASVELISVSFCSFLVAPSSTSGLLIESPQGFPEAH